MSCPNYALGATLDFRFTTIKPDGTPITIAGSPVVQAFVDNGTSGITSGVTLTVDLGGRTGHHNVRVAATSGNGFATNSHVALTFTAGTVDGIAMNGYLVKEFDLEKQIANVTHWGGVAIASAVILAAANIGSGAFTAAKFAAGAFDAVWTVTSRTLTSLGAALVQEIWDRATTALTSAGSIGKYLLDNIGTLITQVGNIHGGTTIVKADLINIAGTPAPLAAPGTLIVDIGSILADSNTVASLSAWLSSIHTGTPSSGTTTTLIDPTLTQSTTDWWKDSMVVFFAGTLRGQRALVTGFNPLTDQLTFTPALTAAASNASDYLILPDVSGPAARTYGGTPDLTPVLSRLPTTLDGDGRMRTGVESFNANESVVASLVTILEGSAGIAAVLTTDSLDAVVTLTAAEFETYTIRSKYSRKNTANQDLYSVRWSLNGVRLTAGCTAPTIRVTSVSTGAVLVNDRTMTAIDGGAFRYVATPTSGAGSTNERQNSADDYLVLYSVTHNSVVRQVEESVGRDTY